MDGSLVVRCGVPDVGGGQASSLGQIAAEVLGVDFDRVSLHIADSALTPLAGTTTASRQLYMSGNAVLKAARELRAQILAVAATLLGADRTALDLAGGAVVTRDGRALPLAAVLGHCARAGVPRSHLAVYHAPAGEPVDLATGSGKVFPDYTFGAHAAEVEVDTETGLVRVLGYAAAHDVGRAINPQSVEGQIQGGAVQGLGYGLMEEVVVENGINLTTSFATYLIPTAADVPDVRAVVVESGEGLGPFNARGIGEPPIGPPAATIANAIEAATGARITRLPITAERVARALGCSTEHGRDPRGRLPPAGRLQHGHVMTRIDRSMRTRQSASVTVKIAELKNRLSHYLRRVQRGESILVCDRDRVIARIERAGTHSPVPGDDAEWLDRLERRGVVRRGSGTLSRKWIHGKPRVRADVVAALLRERDEGR